MTSFEELDYSETPLGALELRRRRPPSMPDTWVYEVKLDDRFLMSSLNHASEEALAEVGLAFLAEGHNAPSAPWTVMIGGLGLGHTARAALEDDRIGELEVHELLPAVIRWHESGLVPLGQGLCEDSRCALIEGDALETLARGPEQQGTPTWDAVLIDIDDSPEHLLAEGHSEFYSDAGLGGLLASLKPGGIAAIWASLPVEGFDARVRQVFGNCVVHDAVFHNALLMEDEFNPIYLARRDD
ncbi:MAG: spermidine synthase [Planctomycetota bacterium]